MTLFDLMSAVQPASDASGRSSAGSAPVLSLRALTRCYGGCRVLGPVDLDLDRGAVCLVEGANGSGKTTLLRVAAGLLAPSGGTRRCAGPAIYLRPGAGARDPQTVARALGWAERMTAGRGVPVAAACEALGLTGLAHARVASLSAGQRARVSVAVALVAGPAVACLDEPAAHLDGQGVRMVAEAVRVLAARGCVALVAAPTPGGLAGVADGRVRLAAGRPEVVVS